MKTEHCCGFVPCLMKDGTPHYLLVRSVRGNYGFPKGHMESGETELQTALRELKEETSLNIRPIDEFRQEIEYPIPGTESIKRVVFFAGLCADDQIICQQSEVQDAVFATYDQAAALLPFDGLKAVLQSAHALFCSLR